MKNLLIENINMLHTTDGGADRIRKNLVFGNIDAVEWCRKKILDANSVIEKHGKNWYIHSDRYVITVNASSYTIITAHKK